MSTAHHCDVCGVEMEEAGAILRLKGAIRLASTGELYDLTVSLTPAYVVDDVCRRCLSDAVLVALGAAFAVAKRPDIRKP